MRVIPVIDLLDGLAVHAIKGDRKNYHPLQSVLCNRPDPIAIARSFRSHLGLQELYLADLNAIQHNDCAAHRRIISTLAADDSMDVILDAGISEIEEARSWLRRGITKAVIGAETLRAFDAISEIPKAVDPNHLVFSLDLRAGTVVSRCVELASMSPMEVLEQLQSAGWREVIVLDLIRVGSGMGIDQALISEAQGKFPGLKLLVGGGIAHAEQLQELRTIGVAGVLLATTLHRGDITACHIESIA